MNGLEEGASSSSTRARRNLSYYAVVQCWNAAATVSYLRDALLVQLPTRELTDEEGGVAKGYPWCGGGTIVVQCTMW